MHVCRQFYPCIGGTEIFVYQLAQIQRSKGFYTEVLTLNRDFRTGMMLRSKEVIQGLSIHRVPFRGSQRYPLAFSCAPYFKNFDIIHVHGVDFFIDYICLLKKIHRKKIILHTHGGYFHTKFMLCLKKFYFYSVTRMVLKQCDKIIAVSTPDYDVFSRITKNITQINNGIDYQRFSSMPKKIQPGTLAFVGRIDEHKRIDRLVSLTSLLKEKGLDVNLKIIGPDWKGLLEMLTKLAISLGVQDRVMFLGEISNADLVYEYPKAHIFVSASEYEGFGISVLEAMASGTVCVLNDIPAFRQFIQSGRNGFIADYEDLEQVSSVIKKVLEMGRDEYARIGECARGEASRYDWNCVHDRIAGVYQEVLRQEKE